MVWPETQAKAIPCQLPDPRNAEPKAVLRQAFGVREVERSGLRNDVWIMVGGAPITQNFSDHIHADVYTPDAIRAGEAALAIRSGQARKSLIYDSALRRYRHV